MKIKIIEFFRAAIISIIVALLFIVVIVFGVKQVFGEQIKAALNLLAIITVNNSQVQEVVPLLEGNVLHNNPTYGSKYATLNIESIGINLPVYYGANYNVLKSGIAHDENSYFPGEGGSVIMAGHNFRNFLAPLPNAQIGDEIVLETNYGTFLYEINDTKIINEHSVDEVPIQKDKEILMLYTCWPINNIGHASQRYVVYAEYKGLKK